MNIKISGTKINGTIKAIPSKSYAHRIAICNFLAGNSPVSGVEDFSSADIIATERCLSLIKDGKTVLDCGESGSTLRFLLPLCAALSGDYEFIGHGKLMDRPNDELFSVMREHGVTISKEKTIKIRGKLSAGEFRLRGDISSQYVTGLLLALPILQGDSKIVLTTPLSSAPYVNITLEVLKGFGVEIEKTEQGFFVGGSQTYHGQITAEGDWSNSAFFLTLGALCGKVTVTGLNLDSVQGDKVILDVLESSGAILEKGKDQISVQKSLLKSFVLDAEDCPDLVPICSALASFCDGVTTIKNIQRLKIKESDRVMTTIAMLNSFGIKAQTDGVNLYVYGGKATSGIAKSFNDHRIAMASAVMASAISGESVIEDAEAVKKSYPEFFNDYIKLGGKAYEL